jgi:hypothetical protein
VVATDTLSASVLLAGAIAMPALAFDIRPDPDSTEGSVRIDGHSRELTCDRPKPSRPAIARTWFAPSF